MSSYQGSLTTSQPSHATFKALAITAIVTEGDGHAILKVFAKISAPSYPPGQPLVLFPESNAQLLEHAVHPLDSNHIPYAFPPKTPPLLQRACRALNTKPPLEEYYADALALARGIPTSAFASSSRTPDVPDNKSAMNPAPDVIGHISVQNYQFTFVTPKYPMPDTDDDKDGYSSSTSSRSSSARRKTSYGASTRSAPNTPSKRRASEKSDPVFMVAMKIKVPFAGMPPQSPYMFVFHPPKCLDNKLKIHLPRLYSASGIDRDDEPTYNVLTQPTMRQMSSSQLSHGDPSASVDGFADDEDANGSDCVMGGAFQALNEGEALIVRWTRSDAEDTTEGRLTRSNISGLSPLKSRVPRSRRGSMARRAARKRANVSRVQSSLSYTIHPLLPATPQTDGDATIQQHAYIPVDLRYSARCVGLSHPGVETQLGLEVKLDEHSSLLWARTDATWDVQSSSPGYEEFFTSGADAVPTMGREETDESSAAGGSDYGSLPNRRPLARGDTVLSEDSGPISRSRPSPGHPSLVSDTSSEYMAPTDRMSLTRAPLPNPATMGVDDYSMEQESLMDTDLSPVARRNPPLARSRDSSGPLSSLGTNFSSGKGVSRTGSNESGISGPAVSESLLGSEALPSPTTLSGYTNFMDATTPTDPIVLNLNLMKIFSAQRVANPLKAEISFDIVGQIHIPVDVDDGKALNLPLPVFRIQSADEQRCAVEITSSTGVAGPFGVQIGSEQPMSVRPGEPQKRVGTLNMDFGSEVQEEGVTLLLSGQFLRISNLPKTPSRSGKLPSQFSFGEKDKSPVKSPAWDPPVLNTGISTDSNMTLHGRTPRRPADELNMPSPIASIRGERSLAAFSSFNNDRALPIPAITRVQIEVVPTPPPKPKDAVAGAVKAGIEVPAKGAWSYLVRTRSSWPFMPGSKEPIPLVEFTLPRLQSFGDAAPRVIVRSAALGDRPLQWRWYPSGGLTQSTSSPFSKSLLGEGGAKSTYPTKDECLGWVKIELPDDCSGREGELVIQYLVELDATSTKKAKLDVLLPTFTVGVNSVEVAIRDVDGYSRTIVQTDLNSPSGKAEAYDAFALPANSSLRLSCTLYKRFFKGRLVSSASTTWHCIHFALTLLLLYTIWTGRGETIASQQRLLLPRNTSSSRFPALSTLFNWTTPILHGSQEPMSPSSTIMVQTPTSSSTAARKLPKETYVPPDNLWGEWDTSSDPFSSPVESFDPEETAREPSMRPPESSASNLAMDAPSALGTFYNLLTDYPKYQHRILYIAKGLLDRFLSILVSVFHFPN